MDTRQVSQSKWLPAYLLPASILILLLSVGNFLLFSHTLTDSMIGMPAFNTLILSGVFLAVPAGLLNLWLGISSLKKDRRALGRASAVSGLLAGVLGLATGLIWWGALTALLLGRFR